MTLFRSVFNILFIASLAFLSFVANVRGSAHNLVDLRSEPASSSNILDKQIVGRTLRAAQLQSNIKTRSFNELMRYNHELYYIDDSPFSSASQFSAQLRATTIKPTLMLEEVDDQLDQVICHDSTIDLSFGSEDTLRRVYREFISAGQFFLITSHETCNNDGERNVYLVSDYSIDKTGRLISLMVTQRQWKDVYGSLTVEFGSSSSNFEVRRHSDLRKRQNSESLTVSTSDIAASSSVISFPIPPSSTPTPGVHDAHGDIGKQFINQAILPPSLPGIDGLTLHGPLIPQGLTVSCKNCTTQGTIDLMEGSFTLVNSTNDSDDTLEDIKLFFDSGFIELLINDFSAHIELESTIQPSASLTLYTAPLPEIGIPGFQIPGVGTVGPIFKPLITFGVKVSSVFDVTYGFDVTIPNNSSIIIDIGNLTNSSITGFPDTKFTAIPFQASLDNISLTLSAGFTPELLLGISVFDGHGEAGAGVFLDLPQIKATIAQVNNVDSECNPVANASSQGNNIIDDIFGSLTNIVPEVDFDVGLVAQADLQGGGFTFGPKPARYTAFSIHSTLPTACLSFNAQSKTFGSPTATSSGNDGKGKDGTKGAATVGVVNPFAGIVNRYGRLQVTIGVLAFMLGCFLGL